MNKKKNHKNLKTSTLNFYAPSTFMCVFQLNGFFFSQKEKHAKLRIEMCKQQRNAIDINAIGLENLVCFSLFPTTSLQSEA